MGKNLHPGSCPRATRYPAPTEPDWSTNFRKELTAPQLVARGWVLSTQLGLRRCSWLSAKGTPAPANLLPNSHCKILSAWRKSESLYFKLFYGTDEIWAIPELLLCDTCIHLSLNSVSHQCPHTICSNRFCHLLLSWFPVCASMPHGPCYKDA